MFANQACKNSARAVHVSVDNESFVETEFAVKGDQTSCLEIRDPDYALQRLPAEQREVVLLVGLEEMSYAAVALALDIPIGTVMSRLGRGRERLRSLMPGGSAWSKIAGGAMNEQQTSNGNPNRRANDYFALNSPFTSAMNRRATSKADRSLGQNASLRPG